ncbi:MAG: GR25 family glycosyltransferase involved in LPS biosynthesis [Gammaproteobacteria bacterium]|jgi:GR25 family glycosyltransferase involved in LPS biosynthesis
MINLDKIYYINLNEREDRREFMEGQLSKIKIPHERFTAIRPSEEDLNGQYKNFYNRFANQEKYIVPKLLGTLGCYLSHYFVQKKALESTHGNYLVLEDDWTIDSECIKEIKKLFNSGSIGSDWDIFGSFWSSHKEIVIKHQGIIKGSRFYKGRGCQPMGGTHFMLFNKKSTSKIVNFLDCENVFNIDGVIHNDMLSIYHKKMPIKNNGFSSDIQQK